MNNNFYVYCHLRLNSHKVFYVGKGKGNRAWRRGRNDRWNKTVKKDGSYHVIIVAAGLSEESAFDLERKLITWYDRKNLCNMTNGGDGISGHIFSKESKMKISESRKGQKPSEETKVKLRLKRAGRTPTKGMKHTDETREKIRQGALRRYANKSTILKTEI